MTQAKQFRIPATFIRGGTSKGVFYNLADLPTELHRPGLVRDKVFLRVLGSPDIFGRHIDGMGGATSSSSKAVIISKSNQPGHDVDYLFGQAAIDKPVLDWSGNCGNLTPAVGVFAIKNGYIPKDRIPDNGYCKVRIWQANVNKTLEAEVPIANGEVQETGDFVLDGVAFPAAEIKVTFVDPSDGDDTSVLPTNSVIDHLDIPNFGSLEVSMINSGIETVFVRAADIGYKGTELQDDINNDTDALAFFEAIRTRASVRMGLAENLEAAAARLHTPKIIFVAPPEDYIASNGKNISASDINLLVRGVSMGKLHHAIMGTGGVAIATAAAIPGTIPHQASNNSSTDAITMGHTAGLLKVKAKVTQTKSGWKVHNVELSRTARIIMEGSVCVPGSTFEI